MSIKGVFTVVIASTAMLTGLASYSSALFSTQMEQQVSRQNSIPGIEATITDRNNGFFSRRQTYKIVLSAQYLQKNMNMSDIEQDVELYIPHHFVAYPLYITSELNIDFSRGSLPQMLQHLDLTDIVHQINISSNIVLQSSTLTLDMAPLTHNKNDVTFSHDGVKITAVTDLDFKQGSILTDFSGLRLDMGNQGHFAMSDLNSNSSFSTIDGIMLFTAMSGTLNKISFTDNVKNIAFEAENINSTSSYSSLESDQISLVAGINIANMNIRDAIVDYVVTNTEVALAIDEIDKSGYFELEKISRQILQQPEMIKSALMKVVEAGGKGKVTKLNFNVNDVQFNSSADFNLPPYRGALANSELNQHFADNFVMNIDLSLGNNYAEKFAQLDPMVQHFIQRGFVAKDDKGNISSKISFSKGMLTANDNAVQM